MRHSSWTLFLVPLALPLVLLLPGAMKTADPVDPVARATYEQVQTHMSSAASEDSPRETSEALYKD